MTDINMTLEDLKTFFGNLTFQMLGLDPTDPANAGRVRGEWPTSGSPGWAITDDVTFIMLTFDDDAITRQMDTSYEEIDNYTLSQNISYTRVVRCSWVCYGPNSFNDVDTIRSSLFLPQFISQLKANNLALVLDLPAPARAPELFNGQWWDRSNLYARFNELVTRSQSIPVIQTPNVQVIKG